jgi:hypothetical protein
MMHDGPCVAGYHGLTTVSKCGGRTGRSGDGEKDQNDTAGEGRHVGFVQKRRGCDGKRRDMFKERIDLISLRDTTSQQSKRE